MLKIAFRNIFLQKRRSFFIGLTIFISTMLLLLSNAAMNGVEKQMLKGYIYLQSGHVSAFWEGLQEQSSMDVARLFYRRGFTFDIDKDAENKQAIRRLNEYLKHNEKDIDHYYYSVRGNGELNANGTVSRSLTIYGLNNQHSQYLLESGALGMFSGELLPEQRGITMSKVKAEDMNIQVGDKVTLQTSAVTGKRSSLEFTVNGIYANSAGYNNDFIFMNEQDARALLGYDPVYFDIAVIFLKDTSEKATTAFARQLDKHLLQTSTVIRSEPFTEISNIYPSVASNLKLLYTVFICFLLGVISIGLRSTIRTNIYDRMKEFGTLRAIGFSRFDLFMLIFYEVILLSLIFFGLAWVLSSILVLIFGQIGIFVGTGPVSYMFGGESFYPHLTVTDFLITLTVIIVFSLVSMVSPGLKLCLQNITDILAKKSKRVSILRIMMNRMKRPV